MVVKTMSRHQDNHKHESKDERETWSAFGRHSRWRLQQMIMNNKIVLNVVALALVTGGCCRAFHLPAELRNPSDERKLIEHASHGDCMADRRDCMMLVDGLVIVGIKNIGHVPYALAPEVPQLGQRLDSLKEAGASRHLSGYYFLGNDTTGHPVNYFRYLQVPVMGIWSSDAGDGFVAANCIATRYVYDHKLLPGHIEYRVDGHVPDEEQMRRYISLKKRELQKVSLEWDSQDSVLYIDLTTAFE